MPTEELIRARAGVQIARSRERRQSDGNMVEWFLDTIKTYPELAIFIASTMLLKPFASRTILLFSKIQCNWCSGDVVSAKVPNTCECRFVPAVNAQSPTLQYVQQSARVCEPDLDVLVF